MIGWLGYGILNPRHIANLAGSFLKFVFENYLRKDSAVAEVARCMCDIPPWFNPGTSLSQNIPSCLFHGFLIPFLTLFWVLCLPSPGLF